MNRVFEKEGISSRYDESKNEYVYDRRDLANTGYDSLLKYLNDKNIDYEISKSTEAGYVPSIYVKDEDGNTILRIANHDNGYINDFDMVYNDAYNDIFDDRDYINWKDKIVPKLEKILQENNIQNINISNIIETSINEAIDYLGKFDVEENIDSLYDRIYFMLKIN